MRGRNLETSQISNEIQFEMIINRFNIEKDFQQLIPHIIQIDQYHWYQRFIQILMMNISIGNIECLEEIEYNQLLKINSNKPSVLNERFLILSMFPRLKRDTMMIH